MKLKELIYTLKRGDVAVSIELIHRYKRSLRIYFKRYFTSEPVLVPVTVTNACCYCLVLPEGDLYEGIGRYDEDALLDEELMEIYLQYIQPL